MFEEQRRSSHPQAEQVHGYFQSALETHVVRWTNWLTKEAVWRRFQTISHIANLKGDDLEVGTMSAYWRDGLTQEIGCQGEGVCGVGQ